MIRKTSDKNYNWLRWNWKLLQKTSSSSSIGDLHKDKTCHSTSTSHRTILTMIQIHYIYICWFSLAIASGHVHAFVVLPASSRSRLPLSSAMASNTAIKAESDGSTAIVDTIQTSFRIAQESNAAGYGFKQILADVLAGDFDQDAVSQTIDETVASAPCGT